MTKKDVIEHFGSVRAVADALGLEKVQAIYQWGDEPPRSRQFQLQVITKGKLKVSPTKNVA